MKTILISCMISVFLLLYSVVIYAKEEKYLIPIQNCSPMAVLLYRQMLQYGESTLREHQLSVEVQNTVRPEMAAMLIRYWDAASLSGKGANTLQMAQEWEKQCIMEAGDVSKMFTDPKYFQERPER